MSLGGHGHGGHGQPQFRYIQPPSKVLHLRNLPWECGEEEIVELCNPFGRVINTKCNVGANRNQAFVEFADLNQAIAMVSYYASSSEPARVRGKTVYLQYSNRQEVVNNKNTGDVPSNVLLVTIEGVEAGDVTIDVLHLVFSAFGFVHKIATFEKTAGFQALVQFNDPETASSARQALDGRSIPRYLLAEHVGTCHLRISFSAHNDLNIKFQSHRSRDYTNPYLPVAPSAMDTPGQDAVGPDGKKKEAESNVLLASIENMQYIVTIDALHAVFSAFGTVQKIAMFEKNAGLQALIQYADVGSAVAGKEALEGHCIYEGGHCKLHLSYSRHTDLNVKVNNDRSRDYTLSDTSLSAGPGASYPDIAIRQLDQDNTVSSRAANNPPYPQGMESNGPLLSSPAYDGSHAMMSGTALPRGLLSLPHQGGLPWSNPQMPYPPSSHHLADGAVPGLPANPHLGSPYPGSSSTPSYGQYQPTQHPPSLASSTRHAHLQ